MNAPGPPLAGRAAIVTGASRGLGAEIARAYAAAGASVLATARDAAALVEAHRPPVETLAVDLRERDAGDRLVAAAVERFGRLDVVVSNAGVLGPLGPIDDVSWDAWVETVQVNLVAAAGLCRAAIAHFRAQGSGKIVQLSGGGATGPRPGASAYAASKAAVVRLVETLAAETAADGIQVNAIAPGMLDTRMLDEVLSAGPDRVGADEYARAVALREDGGADPREAAAVAVLLGSSAGDQITGRLISAVWDPWRSLPARSTELAETDVYTLRRIVPADRGLDWE